MYTQILAYLISVRSLYDMQNPFNMRSHLFMDGVKSFVCFSIKHFIILLFNRYQKKSWFTNENLWPKVINIKCEPH